MKNSIQSYYRKSIEILSSFPGFIIPILIFAILSDNSKHLIVFCATLAVVAVLHRLIKTIFPTIRPKPYKKDIWNLFFFSSSSFPSNHTAGAFMLYFFSSYLIPQYDDVFLLFAISVALSRIYLAKHYPIDILGAVISSYIIFRVAIAYVYL
jgi:undecaprenyl-diphosphatase